MSADLVIEGVTYISSRRASEITGYSQDYVGQLARAGKVVGKRIGGLWYVLADSIMGHKQIADSYVPAQPIKSDIAMPVEDASMVTFDGKTYVSAARAAKMTSYHQDYIGQLARGGKILSRQVGRRWYVDIEALKAHKKEKDALLAAVQAESVGIQKEVPQREDKIVENARDLHYSYKEDARPLNPVIIQPSIESRGTEERTEGRVQVPIHIVQTTARKKSGHAVPNVQKNSVRMPRMSILLKLFYAVGLLVIAVVSFNLNVGEISSVVKRSVVFSQYFTSSEYVKSILQTSAKSTAVSERLTRLISTEISYKRDN